MRPVLNDVVLAVVLGVLVAVASALHGSSLAGALFGAGLCAPPVFRRASPLGVLALVACAVGLTFVVAIVAGLAAVADSPLALVPAVLGAGLLVAALDVNDVGAAATPFEVVLLCCVGIGFAVVFDTPALGIAVPLFLAVIDIAQAQSGGSAGLFTLSTSKPGDVLTLELPDWGTGLAAARLSAPDVIFLGAFAAYARRLGLRERAAELGMLLGLLWVLACLALQTRRTSH